MRTYRLYFRDRLNSHIVERLSFEAQGDLAAIQTAAKLGDGRPMELWDTRQPVKSWDAEQARHLSSNFSEGLMTKMADTDPNPKPDRDTKQERIIQSKKEAQERRDAHELDSETAEAMDAFVNKNIEG